MVFAQISLFVRYFSYRIIHRRVIWLVGQWVGVKLSASLRPVLYQAILPLLEKGQDLVVRLEAANTLKLDILKLLQNRSIGLGINPCPAEPGFILF